MWLNNDEKWSFSLVSWKLRKGILWSLIPPLVGVRFDVPYSLFIEFKVKIRVLSFFTRVCLIQDLFVSVLFVLYHFSDFCWADTKLFSAAGLFSGCDGCECISFSPWCNKIDPLHALRMLTVFRCNTRLLWCILMRVELLGKMFLLLEFQP